jgi:regulator of protease activity HflC (stomatin/prohibitin superfamily)
MNPAQKIVSFIKNVSSVKIIKFILILIIAFVLVKTIVPFTIVNAGERVVIFRLGALDRVLEEGLHLVIPFVERLERIDVKTQKEQVDASAASKDLQSVNAVIALNYNIVPEKAGELLRYIGSNYKTRVIDPAIQESVKSVSAQYTAEELITRRAEVKEQIKESLTTRLAAEYIHVSDVSITNFDFSPSFNEAIESKVTAEQEALRAKNQLERVKYEAEQKVTAAKAEAEAIKIQAAAITQQGGKDYVQLKAIDKWNGILPSNMYGGGAVPFVNVK